MPDPRNCATVPSDSSRTTENGLAWDIISQVGRLVREGRMKLAKACFDFLPARAELDIAGWPEVDIFAHV